MAIEGKVSGSAMIEAKNNLVKDLVELESTINNLDSKVKESKGNLSDNNMREAETLINNFKNILNEMKKGMEELSTKLEKAGKMGQKVERGLM